MNSTPQNLQREYNLRFSENQEYRKIVWRVLVDQYFQPLIGEDKIILDLGSGWGEFINRIRGQKKYAMDLNPDGSHHVNNGVLFIQQDCSRTWSLPNDSLDIVFTSNFFEHLPTKNHLSKTISEVKRCLRLGGNLICLGPNIKYVGGAYWDFFDHYLPLSELSLCEIIRMHELKVTYCIPRFLPYTMANGRRPPPLFISIYLKLPILWRFLGKQFLVIAKKN